MGLGDALPEPHQRVGERVLTDTAYASLQPLSFGGLGDLLQLSDLVLQDLVEQPGLCHVSGLHRALAVPGRRPDRRHLAGHSAVVRP